MEVNSPQLQNAMSNSQKNKANVKDLTSSPQVVSPNQQYNFTSQNLNIFVQNYDEQPNILQEIQLIKNKDHTESINAEIMKFKSDQLSLIQENISENTPQTFSSNSQNSPSKIQSKFSSMSVDVQDYYDPRPGAIKRQKLFTLTDLESFGGRNKKDLEEIVPLTEEVENKSAQVNISRQLHKINSNTIIKETTQKRKTIQSKTHRSHVVTIRTPDMIWKQKFFFIMSYVSRMVMKMKQVKIFRHPELLFETQLNAINDKAAKDISDDNWGQKDNKFFESLQKSSFLKYTDVNKRNKYKYILKRYQLFRKSFRQKMKPMIECFLLCTNNFQKYISAAFKKIQTFDSTSFFILIWSNFIFLLTVCISIYLPYEYCFNVTRENPAKVILNIIMPIVHFLNIAVIANTTYFEKGNVINDHASIFLRYLKSYFFLDIISTISFFIPSENILIFLFFLRWFFYKNFLSKQTERLLLYSSVLTYINIIKLLVQILFICHLGSCIWYQIGYNQLHDTQSGWLYQTYKSNEIQSQQNLDLYLLSIQTIISNTSFFQQRNSSIFLSRQEIFFLIAMSILGISLFAYLLYEIKKILKVFDKRREEYLKELKSLSNYMSTHEVDPYLRERSRKYLEFMYSEEQEQQWSTQESLNSLSNYLKQEIIKDVFMKAVKKISLFRRFFSYNPKFLEKLALRSKEISFGPDELIMRQGNVEIPCLYIVTHGEIQLFVEMGSFANKQQKIFKKVQANQCFGMFEFFSSNYEVQLSAKSLGVSRMLCITQSDMLELLREFPKEREAFCYLKDLITFKQDLSQVGLYCYSCNQVNHYALDCPYLFYGTQPQKVIKEINKQIKHTILHFRRSVKRKKIKSILQNYLISHKAQLFQEKFLNMLESLEQEQYSSDTSIQFLGETSQYSSNDIETHTLNQSRFDRKSILRVHSGSSKFTARHKHKDSESQKSHIGSRLDQSKEEKEGTFNRGRPSSVSISKFGRLVKISDVSVGQHGEEPSELKSVISLNTKDRRISLSNNYEINTVGRINSAEFFNNEDSKRIASMLRRSESEQQLSYENILDKYEQEQEENQSPRRNEKRHSTHQTNKTNKTNRTNKTSKTTITKTLQQLDMDGSLNSLHQSNKSNSISSAGQIEIDKNVNQIKFSNIDANNNISPIHNPRKESQNSNSMYNNNSSNIINQLYQLPSSSMNNNIPPTSSFNALNNAINLGNQQSSIPINSGNSIALLSSNLASNIPSSQNAQQASILNDKIQVQASQTNAVVSSAQNNANNSVNHSNSLNQNNTMPRDTNNSNTQKQNSVNLNQQRSLSITQQTPSQKFTQQFSIYPIENKLSYRSQQPIETIQSYSVSIGTVKSFELYFPQNNVENIIERYNKLQRKKVSRRVRKKRTTYGRETKKRSHLNTLVSNKLIEEVENKHIHPSSSGFDIEKMNSSQTSVNIQSNSAIPYRPPSKKDIFNLNTFNLNDNFPSLNKPYPQIISLK